MIPNQKNKNKHYQFLLLFLITGFGLFAQSPSFISYQGAARNALGTAVASSSIAISFEIRQGSASSSPVFTETQILQTNELGLFSTKIGTTNATSFNAINWQAGAFFLQIGIDVNLQDGISYTDIGVQEVASVPFAFYSQSVPSSFTNNILSIGNATYALLTPQTLTAGAGIAINSGSIVNTSPNQTVNLNAGTNILITGTYPDYTITANPTLALNGNNLSISGGNTVTIAPTLSISGNTLTVGPTNNTISLPAATTPSISGAGIATVNPSSGYNFTVSVAQPTFAYSNATGSLTSGTSSAYITPTIGLTGNTLNIGPPTNSLTLPVAATPSITGSGIAAVTPTTGYNFNVSVPSPTFSNVGQNIITGTYPNYSVNTPTIANTNLVLTNTAAAGPSLATTGTNSFALNIPPSTQAWNLTGNAGTNSGTNYIGTSDANNLSIKTNNQLAVTVNTLGYVGIGTSAPSALLNVINTNSLSDGISVDNNNVLNGGNALQVRHFGIGNASYFEANGSSTMGHAIIATSNSDVQHTVRSLNTSSLLTSYAGMFEGGLIGRGKNNANSLALVGKSFSGVDLFVVRNDGAVGIGTNAPATTLHVVGTTRLVDGSQGLGKVLTSDALGNASWATPASGWGLSGSAGTSTVSNYIGTSDAASLLIKTNAIQRMVVNSTGEVGFGSGYVPGAPVVMQGQSANLGVLKLYNSNASGGDQTFIGFNVSSGYDNFDIARIASERSSGGGEGRLLLYTGGFSTQVERMRIDEFGRVGIGTSAATATFQVNGTTRLVDGTQGLGKVLTSDGSGNASWATPASGWNITGNAGTTAGTNFIGTTDAVGLRFKVNNVLSGHIDPTTPNAFFGYAAGSGVTSGSLNAGFGHLTLGALSTGIMNSAVGYRALGANNTGNGNSALGSDALLSNTSGIFNVGVGLNAGRNNTTGGQNVALGKDALMNNSTGSSNIAIGYQAGFTATGTANVFLGNSAGSTETGSNKLYIANSSGTPLIYGDFANGKLGINTTTPTGALSIDNASVTSRDGIHLYGGRDEVGSGMPMHLEITTSGQTFGSNTYGRIIRLNNPSLSQFYDIGIGSTGNLFMAYSNNYSPAAVNISTLQNIGISHATPNQKLTVNGNIGMDDAVMTAAPGRVIGFPTGSIGNHGTLQIQAKSQVFSFTAFTGGNLLLAAGDFNLSGASNSLGGEVIIRGGMNTYDGSGGGNIIFQAAGGAYTERMRIEGVSGNVGIGTNAPAYQLQLSANSAAKPGSNAWTIASDAALKTNVHDYTDGLKELLAIKPVWYTYTGEANMPRETFVGVIAQDLKEVAPYMVKEWTFRNAPTDAGKTYLGVDNGSMTYMMINAIKEQQQQIEEMKKTIELQQRQIDALKTK